MYPFGSLPGNLAAFGDFLRREHRFRVVHSDLQDAARALEIVDLTDELSVRHALRPIFSRTSDETRIFDRAFSAFFFPGPTGVPQPGQPSLSDDATPDSRSEIRRASEQRQHLGDSDDEDEQRWPGDAEMAPVETTDADDAAFRTALGRYSPLEGEGAAPTLVRVDASWRDAARALVRRLHLGLSRRWRPAPRGRRFDLRRTLRTSLQSGGETLVVRWLRHPRRAPKFVVFIDGSRSMGGHAETALMLATALATATMRIEVFTFSTALKRITRDIRRAAAGEVRRLEHLHHGWAGGTSIGACLREFLHRFGERMIGRDTVVVVFSDGLDVGEPARLRDTTRELRRRAAAVVWLNPLLDTPGYEPTAAGMAAARPYVTTFSHVNDPIGLVRLSRVVRLRA